MTSSIIINGVAQRMQLKDSNSFRDYGDGKGTDYILIQLKGPLTHDQYNRLKDVGKVDDFERIGQFLYLCRFLPTDLTPVQSFDFVSGVQIYRREFKIDDGLRQKIAQADMPNTQSINVAITLHSVKPKEVTADTVAKKLVDELKFSQSQLEPHASIDTIVLRNAGSVELKKLMDVAALDAVKTITEVADKSFNNDRAREILGLNIEQLAGLPYNLPPSADGGVNQLTFQGEGQVIAVADTGLDNGVDDDTMHPAFKGRIKKLISIGRAKYNQKCDDRHGHGTHVCGSAVGGLVPGHKPVQGAAPQAKLVMQSLYEKAENVLNVPTDEGLVKLFTDPYDQYGAKIHSNSWGDSGRAQSAQKSYSNESRLVDGVVFERPDLLILFSAGNDGNVDSNPTIAGMAASKNVLTVGASESTRPSVHGVPVATKLSDNDPTEIPEFSARGPTRESRIKPDVLGPGTAILSARTQWRKDVNTQEFTADEKDVLFCYAWGTSMATPLVAGSAAVLREFLVKVYRINPSASLIKALLINGAYMFHHAHSSREGFGLINVANSLLPKDGTEGAFFDSGPISDVDASQETARRVVIDIPQSTIDVKATGPQPLEKVKLSRVGPPARRGVTLKATMAFTDAPGETLQSTFILYVKSADGIIRYGNKGSSKYFDRYNNVQQVVWKGICPGEASVHVWARELSFPNQGYSLVWRLIPNED